MAETLETVETIEAAGVELVASGPAANVADAKETAQELQSVIDRKDMSVQIGATSHIKVEALYAMASIKGCTVHIERTGPIGEGDRAGWEARCVVRASDGREIASAESMCTRAERSWSRRDDFALRSMAQTRAASKALRQLFSFVAVLAAGVDSTTPAEEMVDDEPATPELPEWARPVSGQQLHRMATALTRILDAAGVTDPGELMTLVGRGTRERCDGSIPICLVATLDELAQAITAASGEPEASS